MARFVTASLIGSMALLLVTGAIAASGDYEVTHPPHIIKVSADARFRIVINKTTYFRVVSEIRRLHETWTSYELVVHNCNSFVSEIASSVGLRTPMMTAQYPVHYVAELRALNSHP